MKLSTIVTGNILLIIVVSGLFLFLSDSVLIYQPVVPSDYNESFNQIINQMNEISNTLNETNALLKVESPTDTSIFDYIGFFFQAGYQGLQVLVNSILLNNEIIGLGVEATVGNSSIAFIVKGALLALVLLSILAIIMSIIFKWDT